MASQRLRLAHGAIVLSASLLVARLGAAAEPTLSLETAQQRFDEGAAAYEAGDFEAARVAYAQAYALEPTVELLANLGHAELRTGHYVKAARHLAKFLRESTIGEGAERGAARKGLLEAERKVGRLEIVSSTADADVSVDGESVGKTPLDFAWHVEPGEHRVRVGKPGFRTSEVVFGVSAGQSKNIELELEPSAPALPNSPVNAVNDGAAAGTAHRSPDTQAQPPSPATDPGMDPTERSMVPVVIGGSLAVAGFAASIIFPFVSEKSATDRDDALADLRNKSRLENPCAGDTFSNECNRIRDLNDKSRREARFGFIGLGVAAVAAVGVIAYLDWPNSNKENNRDDKDSDTVSFAPRIDRNGGGLELTGSF